MSARRRARGLRAALALGAVQLSTAGSSSSVSTSRPMMISIAIPTAITAVLAE